MKYERVTVSLERTVENPQNRYAPMKPGLAITVVLEEGDESAACVERLQEAVRLAVDAAAKRLQAIVKS